MQILWLFLLLKILEIKRNIIWKEIIFDYKKKLTQQWNISYLSIFMFLSHPFSRYYIKYMNNKLIKLVIKATGIITNIITFKL